MSDQSLNSKWNFYYAPRGRNSKVSVKNPQDYQSQLKDLGEFDSVKGFFELYCFLKRPSEIPTDHKLMMFRNEKKPLWEQYQNGGTWIIQLKRKEEEELNKKWEQLLLACIGEQFDTTEVIGIVISRRQKRNLLEIWIENGINEKLKIYIGEKLRTILQMDYQNLVFYYKKHENSLKDLSMFKGIEKYQFKTTPCETPIATPQNLPKKEDLPVIDENFKLS